MIERVEQLMREVADRVVLPRFGRLMVGDIEQKAAGDVVTIVDREVEQQLGGELMALLPGSQVIGEEGISMRIAGPPTPGPTALFNALTQPVSVWLIDPIDGTGNFAAGREPFAIMVALVRQGVTEAGWILDPIHGVCSLAVRGGGARVAGATVTTPTRPRAVSELRGCVATGHAPAEVASRVAEGRSAAVAAIGATVGEVLPGANCAAYEYPAIVRDEQQFAFFWQTYPWDHAAGVLLVEEAGGVAWHLDATPFVPGDLRPGLLVAQNQQVWDAVRTTLLAGVAPSAAPA